MVVHCQVLEPCPTHRRPCLRDTRGSVTAGFSVTASFWAFISALRIKVRYKQKTSSLRIYFWDWRIMIAWQFGVCCWRNPEFGSEHIRRTVYCNIGTRGSVAFSWPLRPEFGSEYLHRTAYCNVGIRGSVASSWPLRALQEFTYTCSPPTT